MQTQKLGCLSGTGIVTALITMLILGGLYILNGGVMFSPGDLNAQAGAQPLGGVYSHAETGGKCSACHTAIWEPAGMADRCLECHLTLLQDGQDFHSVMLAQGRVVSCVECHTDHRGGDVSLTMMEMDHFPHFDTAGFALAAHQKNRDGTEFTCSGCHGEQVARFEPTICLDCHRELDAALMDAHTANFSDTCLDCHDGRESVNKKYDHRKAAFQLEGEHAGTACVDCHQGAASLADLQNAPQDCFACHAQDDEHGGSFGQACQECHTPADWENVTFDHDRSAFPLTGGHREAACEACHQDGVFKGTPQECYSCHAQDDEHAGQLGQDCGACHTPDDWENVTFDHARSAFALTGAHVNVACENCHTGGVYRGAPQDCVGCHRQDDEHGGQFGEDCAICHTTDDWDNATFDHSLSAFALTGAHERVECTQCHRDQVFKGTPTVCSACHAEPGYHAGLFASTCETCHTTAAWTPASYDGSHRFPMNHGEGGASTCQVCHPSSLTTYTCYGCHEHNQSNIAGEHREEGISDFNDCIRCHPTGREEEGEGGGGDD